MRGNSQSQGWRNSLDTARLKEGALLLSCSTLPTTTLGGHDYHWMHYEQLIEGKLWHRVTHASAP